MSKRARPGPLTAIAIIALAVGGLGVCTSTSGLAMQAGQGTMQRFNQQLAPDPQAAEAQREMEAQIEEATAGYMPFSIAHQVLNLLLSLGLLVAGVLLLRWHPKGPAAFTAVAVGNLGLDVAGVTLGVLVQMATSEAMEGYLEATAVPGSEQMVGAIAEASVGMGICMAAAMFLAKAGFYVWGIVYLRRPDVASLFRPEAHAGPPPGTPVA